MNIRKQTATLGEVTITIADAPSLISKTAEHRIHSATFQPLISVPESDPVDGEIGVSYDEQTGGILLTTCDGIRIVIEKNVAPTYVTCYGTWQGERVMGGVHVPPHGYDMLCEMIRGVYDTPNQPYTTERFMEIFVDFVQEYERRANLLTEIVDDMRIRLAWREHDNMCIMGRAERIAEDALAKI